MIEAFFLDADEEQIFTVYHPPAGAGGRVLTVICPPLFLEYMRTQLALRELAISLAERGQHVLRFDYRGTGDSSADLLRTTVSDWADDIAAVVEEGLAISGCDTVRLVGVRAGALLACLASASIDAIDRVVMWDPVLDGEAFVDGQQAVQRTFLHGLDRLDPRDRRASRDGCAGFAVSDRLVADLRALDSAVYGAVRAETLRVVCSSAEASFPIAGVDLELSRFSCGWDTDSTDLMRPLPVLERLTTCLTAA